MDVKALYPSLDIEHTIEVVSEMFKESEVKVEGVDCKEIVLYIALNKTQSELDELGIAHRCPKRKYRRGPRPNILSNGMKDK